MQPPENLQAGGAGPAHLLATSTGIVVGAYVWSALCALLMLVAVIRIVRRPKEEWRHGNWSKVGWVAAVMLLTVSLAGLALPVGASAACWRTRRDGRRNRTAGQLPRETGAGIWPYPWSGR